MPSACLTDRCSFWIDQDTARELERRRNASETIAPLFRSALAFVLREWSRLERGWLDLDSCRTWSPEDGGGQTLDPPERGAGCQESEPLDLEHDEHEPLDLEHEHEPLDLEHEHEHKHEPLDLEHEHEPLDEQADPIAKSLRSDQVSREHIRAHVCDPALPSEHLTNFLEKSSGKVRANDVPEAGSFDPATSKPPTATGTATPESVFELWREFRKIAAARWRVVNSCKANTFQRMPRKGALIEATRRRLDHACNRMSNLEDWRTALEEWLELTPLVVNKLFLWEIDRFCRIPRLENESPEYREIQPNERPTFAERLAIGAYASWGAEKAAPALPSCEAKPTALASSSWAAKPAPESRKADRIASLLARGLNEFGDPISPAALAESRKADRIASLLARGLNEFGDPISPAALERIRKANR